MMRKIISLGVLAMCLSPLSLQAKDLKVTVTNTQNVQRQELVALDVAKVRSELGLTDGETFVVKNGRRQQVDYQVTYDGQLLFDASVRPKNKATFTISSGKPMPMKQWVKGSFRPDRADDMVWENDRGAYRAYGPALERSGEKAYGFDVWTKNTPDLVVDERYTLNATGDKTKRQLEKEGKKEQADSAGIYTSFHYDHGYGLDAYGVGATLGCGTPALMVDGELVMPYCYREYRILDNGPLRFTVELTYAPKKVGNDENVVEHRVISLDKGSNFNKIIVWYDGLTRARDLASGVVIHKEDTESVVLGMNFVAYADPTDNAEGNCSQLYVATLYPNGKVSTTLKPLAQPVSGATAHALGMKSGLTAGEKYTYYFGSAWSKYDVRTFPEWQLLIQEFLDALRSPLAVSMDSIE